MNYEITKEIIKDSIEQYTKTANGLALAVCQKPLTQFIFAKLDKAKNDKFVTIQGNLFDVEDTTIVEPTAKDIQEIEEYKQISSDKMPDYSKLIADSPVEEKRITEEPTSDIPASTKPLKPTVIGHPWFPIPIVLKDNATLPEYGTEFSSGFDILANFSGEVGQYFGKFNKHQDLDYYWSDNGEEVLCILPHRSMPIPTGLFMAIPIGMELQIRPRSGNSIKLDMKVANAPGTIDADYRGEIIILVSNDGNAPLRITPWMKVAQGVLCPIFQTRWDKVDKLPETMRGDGGFGSTDKKE